MISSVHLTATLRRRRRSSPDIRLKRDTGEREIIVMRWGLVPYFAKSAAKFKSSSTLHCARSWRAKPCAVGRLNDAPLPYAGHFSSGNSVCERITFVWVTTYLAKPTAEESGTTASEMFTSARRTTCMVTSALPS